MSRADTIPAADRAIIHRALVDRIAALHDAAALAYKISEGGEVGAALVAEAKRVGTVLDALGSPRP